MVKQKKSKESTEKATSRSNNGTSTKAEGRIDDNIQTPTTHYWSFSRDQRDNSYYLSEEDFDLTKNYCSRNNDSKTNGYQNQEVPITYEEVYVNNKSSRYMKKKRDYFLE